jgi:hypothetical protein
MYREFDGAYYRQGFGIPEGAAADTLVLLGALDVAIG